MEVYYRCIDNNGGEDRFTIGRIYISLNGYNINRAASFIDDTGRLNGWIKDNLKHFELVEPTDPDHPDYCNTSEDLSYLIPILERITQ